MGQKLSQQRFLFLGAGSAATGIADLICLAMAQEGMDPAAARRRNALFDINGLVVTSRTDLARIMHHAGLFCTSGELARPDVPSGWIGVGPLAVQRVWY